MKKQTQPVENNLSRRNFLQVFAAGAATAVGTVALEFAPLANIALAQDSNTLRSAWLTPATLDPRSASGDSEIAVLNAVYDYLIDTDAASNLVPRLASSWDVSDDGLTYTLQIRDDATFHDGIPVSADDVLWTMQWHIDSESTVANLLSSVASIEAGAGNNVILTLSEPNPDFLYNLTDNKFVILQAGAENIGEAFNGSGPFIMEEMIPGDRAILSANANYWGARRRSTASNSSTLMISKLASPQCKVVLPIASCAWTIPASSPSAAM